MAIQNLFLAIDNQAVFLTTIDQWIHVTNELSTHLFPKVNIYLEWILFSASSDIFEFVSFQSSWRAPDIAELAAQVLTTIVYNLYFPTFMIYYA